MSSRVKQDLKGLERKRMQIVNDLHEKWKYRKLQNGAQDLEVWKGKCIKIFKKLLMAINGNRTAIGVINKEGKENN